MKTYEKPKLMALSLSGNDQLCGTCADKDAYLLINDPGLASFLMSFYGFGEGDPDVTDFVGVFGNEDACTEFKIDGYCKFTGNGGSRLVAWS